MPPVVKPMFPPFVAGHWDRRWKRLSLDGKVAIVTGAAGGIGGATARLLPGSRRQSNARRSRWFRHPPGQDENARPCLRDCADEAEVRRLVEATVSRFGRLDIMVANAGIEGALKPVDTLTSRSSSRSCASTSSASGWRSKCAAATMKSAGGGAIVALVLGRGRRSAFPAMAPTSRASMPSAGS